MGLHPWLQPVTPFGVKVSARLPPVGVPAELNLPSYLPQVGHEPQVSQAPSAARPLLLLKLRFPNSGTLSSQSSLLPNHGMPR